LIDNMGPEDWTEFADIYPALNEWGLRVWLLLDKFFPVEDLFEARQPPGAFGWFDNRQEHHPAGAFIAGCLAWGKRLVGTDTVDRARIKRWIRPHHSRPVVLRWDPRGPSPSEVRATSELATLIKLISDAVEGGGLLDKTSFHVAVRNARETARAVERTQTSTHPRYVALPLGTDLRAWSTHVRDTAEQRLRQRIAQLHAEGLTSNAIAEKLGLDPQTVRRKLPKQ
jgi:hypothetical protein